MKTFRARFAALLLASIVLLAGCSEGDRERTGGGGGNITDPREGVPTSDPGLDAATTALPKAFEHYDK